MSLRCKKTNWKQIYIRLKPQFCLYISFSSWGMNNSKRGKPFWYISSAVVPEWKIFSLAGFNKELKAPMGITVEEGEMHNIVNTHITVWCLSFRIITPFNRFPCWHQNSKKDACVFRQWQRILNAVMKGPLKRWRSSCASGRLPMPRQWGEKSR